MNLSNVMNCRAAERLISAERDGALAARQLADLEKHVAGCASCRQIRADLAAAAEVWRSRDAQVIAPDAERAWHDIRRQIRNPGGASRPSRARWWMRTLWAGVPAVGAAALALVVWTRGGRPVAGPETAAASWSQFVQVEGNGGGTPTVIVDEASGWVVVWAGEDATQS